MIAAFDRANLVALGERRWAREDTRIEFPDHTRSEDEDLDFEETSRPVVMELGLHRDGVMPVRGQEEGG